MMKLFGMMINGEDRSAQSFPTDILQSVDRKLECKEKTTYGSHRLG